MAESLEKRVAALEQQVADLLKFKASCLDNALKEVRIKEIRRCEEATDAFVSRDNAHIEDGVYCAKCWERSEELGFLPIAPSAIPTAFSQPITLICPTCGKTLELQYENR